MSPDRPESVARRRNFIVRLIVGFMLINIFVVSLSALFLIQSRQQYVSRAEAQTQNLVMALELTLSGIFNRANLTLLTIIDEAEKQLANGSIDWKKLCELEDRQHSRIPEVTNIQIIQPNGDMVAIEGGAFKVVVNIADREHFIRLKQNAHAGLIFSKPILGRVNNKWILITGRRINNPDGSFAGIVQATMATDSLVKLFSAFDLGKDGVITLRDSDLDVIARHPESPGGSSTTGSKTVSEELRRLVKSGEETGSYSTRGSIDTVPRTFSFRKLPGYPLYLNAGRSPGNYLADWYDEIWKTSILLLLFALGSLFSARLMFQRWKQTQLSEIALHHHNEHLEGQILERTSELNSANEQLRLELNARKRVEDVLRVQEQQLKTIIETVPDCVKILDRDGALLMMNPAGLAMIQAETFDEVKGTYAYKLVNPDYREAFIQATEDAFDGNPGTFSFSMTGLKGCSLWLESHVVPLKNEQGDIVSILGITRDITERRHAEEERIKLEKKLQHSQKLESLGILAGGIAHDFNNILTSIIGHAELANRRINPGSPALDNLRKIEQAAARAADLARQMLAYSGKGRFVIENIDLNCLLEEMLHMVEVSISKKAALSLNLTRPLLRVEADATQIHQVVMNLIINASEALGDNNGTIIVSTSQMHCERSYLAGLWPSEDLPEGLYIVLDIADSGCGMDKDTLAKIFDPFFTTKFTGRGLGMAAVFGIIRGHKGAIKIYSEPGKGSVFKILLPASTSPVESSGDVVCRDDWKGSGTVLLVDDEEIVRSIGSEMLKELGFEVITANDGQDALDIMQSRTGISIVLLDLTMPRLDGEEAFKELRKIKPDIKVIMSSGYNEQDVTQRFVGKGLAGFVQKPYKLSVLRDVLKKLA